MARSNRLFVDLTDIEQWTGIHGGVQRVVYGIAKELYTEKSNREVVFVSFDKTAGIFYESSFEPIYDRVERKQAKIAPVAVLTDESPESQSIPTRLKRRLKMEISTRLNRSVPLSIETSERTKLKMQSNDAILILGMSWESPGMQDVLLDLKRKHGTRVVQLVYDLIICLYPHLHHPANVESYTNNMIGVLKSSDLLLPISKSSARDVKLFASSHKLPIPKIEVIRLGDALSEGLSIKPTSDKKINNSFILSVGTVEIRKNHALLYYTYKLAKERGVKLPQLLIVGGSGWFTGDIQYLLSTDPEIKNDIVVLTSVKDEGLRWLYENCQFTVYPSMYEGWGLPIAESLAYGKACASSNTSSMSEIGGDLVEYFSPYSSQECLEKLQLLQQRLERKAKEARIKSKYEITTWSQTAAQVEKSIEGLGNIG